MTTFHKLSTFTLYLLFGPDLLSSQINRYGDWGVAVFAGLVALSFTAVRLWEDR
jgi:hypothetical protein